MAPLIRPAVARLLRPFLLPAVMAAAGLWLMWLGGYLLTPLGLLLLASGAGLAVVEWRRRQLGATARHGPGVIELSEGVLRYWSAGDLGGEIAVRDLVEIRLLVINGRPHWRLRSAGNEALLIPADAWDAEMLADAFATLPGIDLGALAHARRAAERAGAPGMQVLWRRGGMRASS